MEYIDARNWLDAVPRTSKQLGIVLGLPLVDGVFVTLVLAGVLESLSGLIMVGTIIFGGSATAAIVLSDLDTEPRHQLRWLLGIGVIVIPLAGLQATFAPSIAGVFDLVWLEWVAALVLVVLAAELASSRVRAYLPRPGVVVLVGVLLSFRPTANGVTLLWEPALLARGVSAAALGVIVVASLILLGPHIRDQVNVTRLRFGGAISLGVLAVALLGWVPEFTALIVLIVALVLSMQSDRPSPEDERSPPPPEVTQTEDPSYP